MTENLSASRDQYLISLRAIFSAPGLSADERAFLGELLQADHQFTNNPAAEVFCLMNIRRRLDDLDEHVDFCVDYILSTVDMSSVDLGWEEMNKLMVGMTALGRLLQGDIDEGDTENEDADSSVIETPVAINPPEVEDAWF